MGIYQEIHRGMTKVRSGSGLGPVRVLWVLGSCFYHMPKVKECNINEMEVSTKWMYPLIKESITFVLRKVQIHIHLEVIAEITSERYRLHQAKLQTGRRLPETVIQIIASHLQVFHVMWHWRGFLDRWDEPWVQSVKAKYWSGLAGEERVSHRSEVKPRKRTEPLGFLLRGELRAGWAVIGQTLTIV